MTDNIEIKKQNIINAYRNGNDEQKAFLVNLFGNDIAEEAKPKNIMERVRTFEDACRTLGEEHPMVLAYQNTKIHITDYFGTDDVIAYLKLRIICAALNEGWEPKFTTDEYRWFTWFELFTQQELDDMSEEQRSRVVARSYNYAYALGGVAYANAIYAASSAFTSYGSRLAFKSKELAEYCGKQFIDIWADFVFKVREQPTTMSDE
jgi:hypothetical protein